MSGRREELVNKEKEERDRDAEREREIKEEADGQGKRQADRDIEKKKKDKRTERNAGKSARLLQIYDRTLKEEEQREKGTCRIKEGKLGISAM